MSAFKPAAALDIIMRSSLMFLLFSVSIEATAESPFAKPRQINMLPLPQRNIDIILVTLEKQWKEAHTLYSRRISGKVTMWRVPDRRLRWHILRNVRKGRQFVLIAADPSMPREDMRNIISATQLDDVCVSWLFVRPESEIISQAVTNWKPALACQAIGLLTPNDTVVRKVLWPVTPHTFLNPDWAGLLKRAKPDAPVTKRLSGEQLTVACAKYSSFGHNKASCDHHSAVRIFQILKDSCNLSVNFRSVNSTEEMARGLYLQEWDMMYVVLVIAEQEVFYSHFPLIFLGHETFFSRKSASRTVTLSEVSWESRRIVAATLTLVVLVALTQVLITEGVRPSVQGATGTVSVLLAAVLATSTTEHTLRIRRGRLYRRALLGIWFVLILPLSTYLRSELTSILTLKRPLERIDTLEKLEDALDGGVVAPCVLANTAPHYQLTAKESDAADGSLMRKLRAAFKLNDPEELSTKEYSHCLACTLRNDRVCYGVLEAPCYLRKRFWYVREFREPFKIFLSGIRVRKSLPFYPPLRRLFLALEESYLQPPFDAECSLNETDRIFEFDLNNLFLQHAILQVVSCVVLIVEILIVRCSHLHRRLLHGYL